MIKIYNKIELKTWKKVVDEISKLPKCSSYDEALRLMMKYVDVK